MNEVTKEIPLSTLRYWRTQLENIVDPQCKWDADQLSMAKEALEDASGCALDIIDGINEELL